LLLLQQQWMIHHQRPEPIVALIIYLPKTS
jgi:hypothetical protein